MPHDKNLKGTTPNKGILLDRIFTISVQILPAAIALVLLSPFMSRDTWSAEARASRKHQRHVRNMPDVEATPAGLVTIGQEVNFYSVAGISNTTVDYGLTGGWNIGASFLNARFYSSGPGSSPFQPDVLFNLEKHHRIGRYGMIVVGAQTGAGILPQGSVLMNYSYLDLQWHWLRWNVDFDVGAYYGNAALAGQDSVGWHVNIEVPVGGILRLNGDYLSGNNGLSGASVKMLYPFASAWQLGLGIQIPAPSSGNDYSGLLGLYWH